MTIDLPESILIVGGGCFGLSTALSLVRGPYAQHAHLISVIDRAASPPSTDAASSDYNKIVRQDYSDPLYAKLAHRAIAEWTTPEYAPYFTQSGCLILSDARHSSAAYIQKALDINSASSMSSLDGRRAVSLGDGAAIAGTFDSQLETATFEGDVGYFSPNSGWAKAREAMDYVRGRVEAAGVKFKVGTAVQLLFNASHSDVIGVITDDGEKLTADKVVLAIGAWSVNLVPDLGKELVATGHCVGHIQLTAEEAQLYHQVPVVFHMDTGFYIFPPTSDHIVKFAIHGPGYTHSSTVNGFEVPSTPVHLLGPGRSVLPEAGIEALISGLKRVYPNLASKDWLESRMCWYCDSPSSDWLIDYHPKYPSLLLATGDSGHAFKFLPTIGDFITSAMFRVLPAELKDLWSFERLQNSKGDPSRGGVDSFNRKKLEQRKQGVAPEMEP